MHVHIFSQKNENFLAKTTDNACLLLKWPQQLFYKNENFSYIHVHVANIEAIHVQASFRAFSPILYKSGYILEVVRSQNSIFGIL